MTILTSPFGNSSSDSKLILFHNSRDSPITVVCTKDNPPMTGFGRDLKIGDKIEIHGTVGKAGGGFEVSVPSECAFYDYTYFSLEER